IAMWREETSIGRQQRAGYVDIDRAAFDHEVRLDHLESVMRSEHLRDRIVEGKVTVLAPPRFEREVDRDLLLRWTVHEDKSVVANPRVVRRHREQLDALHSCAGRFERFAQRTHRR